MEVLLSHPRATYVLLEMYEGLAQYCERVSTESPETNRYRRFYKDRVGIEYTERGELREQINNRLETELGAEAK